MFTEILLSQMRNLISACNADTIGPKDLRENLQQLNVLKGILSRQLKGSGFPSELYGTAQAFVSQIKTLTNSPEYAVAIRGQESGCARETTPLLMDHGNIPRMDEVRAGVDEALTSCAQAMHIAEERITSAGSEYSQAVSSTVCEHLLHEPSPMVSSYSHAGSFETQAPHHSEASAVYHQEIYSGFL